tara:strand:- start:576 stop:962 length:387 start_codon:yes stop_codon:yes gene_type:complete
MSILGIGTDIVKNTRIKKLLKTKKFINRIFSKKEIIKSKNTLNKTNYFSKKFAVKEAFVKALGTGFRNGINFKDITITNTSNGKPEIVINSKIKKFIRQKLTKKKINIFVSLSDEAEYSISLVIIETK